MEYNYDFKNLQVSLITSFQKLNVLPLQALPEWCLYNDINKDEFISEIEGAIDHLKKAGLSSLEVKPSQCNFCYPNSPAFELYNPETAEFVVRYVIHQEDSGKFKVEECRNRELPDGENGLPF